MRRFRFNVSITARLIACIVLGGLVISGDLGLLQLRQSEKELRGSLTKRMIQSIRMLQSRLRAETGSLTDDQLQKKLQSCLTDTQISFARLAMPNRREVELPAWPDFGTRQVRVWRMPEQSLSQVNMVDLEQMTMVIAPFKLAYGIASVELLIDGPKIRQANRNVVLRQLAPNWLFMAVMVLLGLNLLRTCMKTPRLTE
jgi:hypothetical protein